MNLDDVVLFGRSVELPHSREYVMMARTYFTLGLSTGAEIVTTPITGSVALATGGTASISPLTNFDRSALPEANGNIHVTLASYCNFSANTTHGWVIAYNAATLAETGNLVHMTNADPGNGYFLGSPWMGGYGAAADSLGNILHRDR